MVPIPAPGHPGGSWECFLDLEYELVLWVQQVVHLGYPPEWRHILLGIEEERRPEFTDWDPIAALDLPEPEGPAC